MTDEVDELQAQWRHSRPGLDVGPAGVFQRVLRIARLTDTLTDAALAGHGIDRAGFEVLSLLVRSGAAVSPARIADALRITRAAVTKRLRQVEAAGLARRRPHGHDGRSAVIEVTAKGRAAVHPALETVSSLEASWLATLPAADRAALEPALRRLLATLVQAAEPGRQ
ncbi:MarR family winged helix-turn-helix transcriptional regulator [Actinoplanes teichomyceticus]|uniref:DNA-binding MarR family transcriptional regulator n=1 Tax=Actinoplanes teichomyceticus TaxID=1867 RepID=A0A561VM71_ACTTI|nr:MarR family transcriptional regulator [Actinoplanes teichomyceticus]TWG12683.1 DNA-binding MarR family transcriptional regulator [Actinoplanes teichomyceticus]GIF13416.1 MarR family transcriptional regulator [Actinoplanes teichomyceticus]